MENIYTSDPADTYKHIAVVDCSKAFSSQEVSLNLRYKMIYYAIVCHYI